jgi:integrase
MAFYELRHAAASMLLECGVTPWDVAIQLGHTHGGQLVMERYGHPSEAGARARLPRRVGVRDYAPARRLGAQHRPGRNPQCP